MSFLLAVLCTTLAFFVWIVIHELSHLLMAKWLLNVKLVKFSVIPSKDLGHWTFGYVKYDHPEDVTPTDWQDFCISWAPRIPGLIACLLFPLTLYFTGIPGMILFLLLGAGIIDYASAMESTGKGHSDIERGAKSLGWSIWKLRLVSMPPLIIPIVTLIMWWL